MDKKKGQNTEPLENTNIELPDTGLYYDECLKQVTDVLETENISEESMETWRA